MHLLIASHKLLWPRAGSPTGFATDGGFSAQMGAIAPLFDRSTLCVPCSSEPSTSGLTDIPAPLEVHPLRIDHPDAPLWRRRVTSVGWLPKLVREVRSADAVHAPLPGDVGTLALLIALAFRKPVFVRHCATWAEPASRADRAVRWILERVAGGRRVVFATGYDDVPPSASNPAIGWIFSSSVRAADIRSAERPRTAPAPGTARIVTGGRLIRAKGADRSIEAFADLLTAGCAAHLDIVGDGPARGELEDLARDLGVAETVRFHGKVSRFDVMAILDASDLFLYPTRSNEGFPKFVLEALARQLPVVATRVSAIPTMVGEAGIVVTDDRDGLVAAVTAIVTDPERYAAAAVAARGRAEQFTLEAWQQTIDEALTASWGQLRSAQAAMVPG